MPTYGRCWTTRDPSRERLGQTVSSAAPCFTPAALVVSATAKRLGIKNAVTDSRHKAAIFRLFETRLQPIREDLGPTTVTSAYRTQELNDAISGSRTSEHRYGNAADIKVSGFSNREVATWLWIMRKVLPFDQVLWYSDLDRVAEGKSARSHTHVGLWLSAGAKCPGSLPCQRRGQFRENYRRDTKPNTRLWAPTDAEITALRAKVFALPSWKSPSDALRASRMLRGLGTPTPSEMLTPLILPRFFA